MRALVLPFALWIGALHAIVPEHGAAELCSAAAGLASFTMMVYRLDVWRQGMVNMKHNVGAGVARYGQESAEQFTRLERRFTPVERFIDAATEHRVQLERWQGRIDTTLEAVDDALHQMHGAALAMSSSAKEVA